MDYEIGDIIKIIKCSEASRNEGLEGTIQYIKDGYLYGDWSDEVLYPYGGFDVVEKIGHEEVSERTTRLVEMSSRKEDTKLTFNGLLKQGIVHLIKLYCYRNWKQIYDYRWADKWIGTVYRNVAVGNDEDKKSYLAEMDYDYVVSNYLDKFSRLFEIAKKEIAKHDYPLPILDEDCDGAKEFTEKYLKWAKPKLLEWEQIDEDEVIAKIYEMLKEVKD